MATILFTSQGSAGDVLPFLRIGSRLKTRGHDVTLLSHCSYQERATRTGLNFAALDSPKAYAEFIEDGPLLNTPRGIAEFMRRHVLPKVLLECELIEQQCRSADTILITRDMIDIAARLCREKLSIPVRWVFIAPSQLTTWQIRMELFRDVLASDINRLRAEVGLAPVEDWHSWLGYPQGNPALWPDWFACSDPTWSAEVVPVGFLMDNEAEIDEIPEEIQRTITSGAPPLLITGGTGMYLGSEFFTASVEACRSLNRRAILVTQYDKQVPPCLPASVQRCNSLPFGKLMPHLGAVIHHGGRGTLSCALAAGIPQLVMAMGADRPDNASRLQRLGVATYLPPPLWQPSIVAESLRQLMNAPAIQKRCSELASRTKSSDALSATCAVIEAALSTEKSARPPTLATTVDHSGSLDQLQQPHLRQDMPHPSMLAETLPPDRYELLALLVSNSRQRVTEPSHERKQKQPHGRPYNTALDRETYDD